MSDHDVFKGPCIVCGESCAMRRYVSLGLCAIGGGDEIGDVMFFRPDGLPMDYEDWGDVAMTRAVHFECMPIYIDGVHADMMRLRRTEGASDS